MLPGFSGMMGGGSIAVQATLNAGRINHDTTNDGIIDYYHVGKYFGVGSWNVQPFIGFTTDTFKEERNLDDSYRGGGLIEVNGTGAASIIIDYKAVTINGVKRSIGWNTNGANAVFFVTSVEFGFFEGGNYSILFSTS